MSENLPSEDALWHPALAHGSWYTLEENGTLWELPIFIPRDGATPSEPRRFTHEELMGEAVAPELNRSDYPNLSDEEINYLIEDWAIIVEALRTRSTLEGITLQSPP